MSRSTFDFVIGIDTSAFAYAADDINHSLSKLRIDNHEAEMAKRDPSYITREKALDLAPNAWSPPTQLLNGASNHRQLIMLIANNQPATQREGWLAQLETVALMSKTPDGLAQFMHDACVRANIAHWSPIDGKWWRGQRYAGKVKRELQRIKQERPQPPKRGVR